MRTKTLQAGPLMQVPVFVLLFLAPVYVPLSLLDRLDPHRRLVEPDDRDPDRGRGFIAGAPDKSALAFACGARPGRADGALGGTRPAPRRTRL